MIPTVSQRLESNGITLRGIEFTKKGSHTRDTALVPRAFWDMQLAVVVDIPKLVLVSIVINADDETVGVVRLRIERWKEGDYFEFSQGNMHTCLVATRRTYVVCTKNLNK
jgi:hypothetical protein